MNENLKFRYLNANEVECRVGTTKKNSTTVTGFSLLLYKDARVDMALLDETVGCARWQRKHEIIDGNLYCSVGINFDGEWVWKQDVGVESNTEKEKGQASDAFKRACFNWGVGRELYTAPFIWVKNDANAPKMYDKFSVSHMRVVDGNITELEIYNNTKKCVEYVFGMARREAQADPNRAGYEAILKVVLSDIASAESTEKLKAIYENNLQFHNDASFMSALTNRKNELLAA